MNINRFFNLIHQDENAQDILDHLYIEIGSLTLQVGDETYDLMSEDLNNEYYEKVLKLCNRLMVLLLALDGVKIVEGEYDEDEIQ